MDILAEISHNLIKGQAPKVKDLTQEALKQGVRVDRVLNEGLIASMALVGERFERKEIFLPEVLFAARAMYAGLDVLEPLLADTGVEPVGKIVLGTVQGDIHDIGKNLVGIMMRGAGFEVIDLGIAVPPQRFVDAVTDDVQLVGMSALTGNTMPFMQNTIEALEVAGLRKKVKTMVGGAIVTQRYADRIGADGYAPDATSAVRKARELLGME